MGRLLRGVAYWEGLGAQLDLLSMLHTFAWGVGMTRSSRRPFAGVLRLHTNVLFPEGKPNLGQQPSGDNPVAIL